MPLDESPEPPGVGRQERLPPLGSDSGVLVPPSRRRAPRGVLRLPSTCEVQPGVLRLPVPWEDRMSDAERDRAIKANVTAILILEERLMMLEAHIRARLKEEADAAKMR